MSTPWMSPACAYGFNRPMVSGPFLCLWGLDEDERVARVDRAHKGVRLDKPLCRQVAVQGFVGSFPGTESGGIL